MARSRAKARLNFSAQGQRSGRCRVNRRAERVSRPARDAGDDVIAGLDAGADDYISKPFDLDQLRARVRVGERAVELQRQRLRRETASYVGQLERAVADLKRSRRRIVAVQEEAAKKALQSEELHGPLPDESRPACICCTLQNHYPSWARSGT